MIEGQCQKVQWAMVSITWPPFMVQHRKIIRFLWPCKMVKKRSRSKQQVLCTMSNGSRRYGVHKVTPVHGAMWEFFCHLAKVKKRSWSKQFFFVHNFIIPTNCWNHDWRSKWNSSLSYGVQKVTPVHGTMYKKNSWPCKKVNTRSRQ